MALFLPLFKMGKTTELHRAAEEGESEKLQRLLETGTYDVNEHTDDKFRKGVEKAERERAKERERERERLTLSYFSSLRFGLCGE